MTTAKKIFVKTYGCQMNEYDSIKIRDLMVPHGYSVTDKMDEADMVVLNTCHIREKAAEKTYSELGRVRELKELRKKQGKKLLIVVAGCTGQAEGDEIFARAGYVDIVVGPQSYHNLPDMVDKIEDGAKHLIELDFIEAEKFDKLPEYTSPQGVSAGVSVQEGCDKFCTFCVVPYTRGAEFSRPLEQVYREVLNAVNNGAKEITLLGQNVNAYHGKSPEGNDISLAKLIEKISEIKSLERIRYMTSHPCDMDDDLIKLHGTESKLMPFLHLPIQSGSNKILKAMNRRHTTEEYFDIIVKLKEARPDIALSSDFIIGFPGETDEDFADTMDIIKSMKYTQSYSYKYSPRPGTPAATKEQVPENIKNERLKILQAEIAKQQFEYNQSFAGKIMPILFDREGKHEGQIIGKSPYMQSVHVSNPSLDLIGKIVDVRIKEGRASSLSGDIIGNSTQTS
jgi:tRNA-2-methylthio-N6-dimethylallyladenosine synthase